MSLSGDMLTILIATALLCGMMSGFIALSKDRSWLGFALIGLLLGPLGLIMTGFAQPAAPTIRIMGEDQERQGTAPPDSEGDHLA